MFIDIVFSSVDSFIVSCIIRVTKSHARSISLRDFNNCFKSTLLSSKIRISSQSIDHVIKVAFDSLGKSSVKCKDNSKMVGRRVVYDLNIILEVREGFEFFFVLSP